MDIFAHSLWTNALYKTVSEKKGLKRSKRDIWAAIWWGIAPDIMSFGPFLIASIFGSGTLWRYAEARVSSQWHLAYLGSKLGGPPDPATIPQYVYTLYSLTHSLVIFLLLFGLVWLLRRRPYWPLAAWGLHIGIDIWSHTDRFFPTPIFYPLSKFHVNGISWGSPIFMLVNYLSILLVYVWMFRREIISYLKNEK